MTGIRNLRRIGILAALVIAVTAVGLAPAAADPPIKSDLEMVLDDEDCGGDLTYDLDAYGTEIVHVKPDGTLSIFQNWRGTIEGNNGKTLRLHHAFTMSIAPDGTFTVTGLPFGIWDGSTATRDRGLLVIDGGLKVAGPHPAFFGYPPPPAGQHLATCDLLAA
jgi:hypothetical protein